MSKPGTDNFRETCYLRILKVGKVLYEENFQWYPSGTRLWDPIDLFGCLYGATWC